MHEIVNNLHILLLVIYSPLVIINFLDFLFIVKIKPLLENKQVINERKERLLEAFLKRYTSREKSIFSKRLFTSLISLAAIILTVVFYNYLHTNKEYVLCTIIFLYIALNNYNSYFYNNHRSSIKKLTVNIST